MGDRLIDFVMEGAEQKSRQEVLQYLLRALCRQIIGKKEEDIAFLLYHFNERHLVMKQEDVATKDNRPQRKQLLGRRKDREKQRKIAYMRLVTVEEEDEKLLLADLCEWLNHKAWPSRDASLSFVDEELETIATPIKSFMCRVENVANEVNACWKNVKEKNQSNIRTKLEESRHNLPRDFVFRGRKVEPQERC